MKREAIGTGVGGFEWFDSLPASPAVRVGDLVFVSGQFAGGGDSSEQARRVFERIDNLLRLAGGSLDDVVDLMSFHVDAREMEAVFDVARGFFGEQTPAWTPVGTTGLPEPGARVSIRAIADLGGSAKRSYTPDTLTWWRSYPFSAGCRKGDLVFVSGMTATDADGFVISPGDHAGQARFAYNRIREIVEALGGSLDDVIDVCSFHQDARGMIPAGDVVEVVYRDVPYDEVPAWTAIATPALPRLGMLGSFRAIADLAPGNRIAKTPSSLWWKTLKVSGGTRKEGGHLIALAGEVASDGDGNITTPGDIAAQARYAFNRLRETLEMFGLGVDAIAEITSFHKDPRAWEIVLSEGRAFFGDSVPPAWTPVGMTGLFKEGYLHEIYALALS